VDNREEGPGRGRPIVNACARARARAEITDDPVLCATTIHGLGVSSVSTIVIGYRDSSTYIPAYGRVPSAAGPSDLSRCALISPSERIAL